MRAHVGHIGSALSIADMIGAVFGVINVAEPEDPGRDRFILSKGHAALALYGALAEAGVLDARRARDVLRRRQLARCPS